MKCTSDVDHEYGQMYFKDQYLYLYVNVYNQDGWSNLLDDIESSDPVTNQICEFVDDLPILTAESMFANSKTTNVDISSLNTNNVTSMKKMFENTIITSVIGLDTLNTPKVTDMNYMFYMTNGKNYHIESFKFNNELQAYGMFDENDNGKPNVYVNN